jgi:environmental stress-induced protein Ves
LSVASAERIDLQRVAPRAWKNGAGLTRELAVSPDAAGFDDFDWRISIAEIARDAPFSAFPGIDRCIVLLHGGGVWLRSPSGRIGHRLDRPCEPFRFAGDEVVEASLIDGPSTDFNVMVRTGRWRADVQAVVDGDTTAPADAALLLCARGQVAAHTDAEALVLDAGQALLWRHASPAMRLRCVEPASQVLLVRLQAMCHDGAA